MSYTTQKKNALEFNRNAALFGVSIVAVIGWLVIVAAPDALRDMAMNEVLSLFDFVRLNPAVSLMAMIGVMLAIVVALFVNGVVKTNRRLDQEMVSKARG